MHDVLTVFDPDLTCVVPFPLLLLLLDLVRGDVGREQGAALVEQLDEPHHGLLLLHAAQSGPLPPGNRGRDREEKGERSTDELRR